MTEAALPTEVRYVKNGAGGQWWRSAKQRNELHLGWREVPHDALCARDYERIKLIIERAFTTASKASADLNALKTLLESPSAYLWITFEDGCMWWCTVRDGITTNPNAPEARHGHFWLTCDRPWSDSSLGGRHLAVGNLPGVVTKTAGYQGTICRPGGSAEIVRIVTDDSDPDVLAASAARSEYQRSIAKLIAKLRPRDFEQLVDLILSRTGWVRLDKIGGSKADVDLEAHNPATDETAFVQVKSAASQATLDEYVDRFLNQQTRYQRMIFAAHTTGGVLAVPGDRRVHVWERPKIAELVVRLGLGEWVQGRV